MSETKARLIGAITVMNESDAQRLWKLIERLYDTGDCRLEVDSMADQLIFLRLRPEVFQWNRTYIAEICCW